MFGIDSEPVFGGKIVFSFRLLSPHHHLLALDSFSGAKALSGAKTAAAAASENSSA